MQVDYGVSSYKSCSGYPVLSKIVLYYKGMHVDYGVSSYKFCSGYPVLSKIVLYYKGMHVDYGVSNYKLCYSYLWKEPYYILSWNPISMLSPF